MPFGAGPSAGPPISPLAAALEAALPRAMCIGPEELPDRAESEPGPGAGTAARQRDAFTWTVAMLSRIDFAAVYLGLLTAAPAAGGQPRRPRPAGPGGAIYPPPTGGRRPPGATGSPVRGVDAQPDPARMPGDPGRRSPNCWASRRPSPHPQAELWIGAHPADSSLLIGEDGRAIPGASVIAPDPLATLGRRGARGFDSAAAVPAEGAGGRRAAVAAGAPVRRAGGPRVRAGGGGRAAAVLAAAQLPGQLAQAGTDLRADRVPRAVRFSRAGDDGAAAGRARQIPQLDHYLGLLSGQPDAHGHAGAVLLDHHHPAVTLGPLLSAVLAACVEQVQGRRRIHRRVPHRAGAGRALPGRPRGAGLAAAQPASPCSRGRRCTCPAATCTPTCPGSASRSWRTPTMCCAAG